MKRIQAKYTKIQRKPWRPYGQSLDFALRMTLSVALFAMMAFASIVIPVLCYDIAYIRISSIGSKIFAYIVSITFGVGFPITLTAMLHMVLLEPYKICTTCDKCGKYIYFAKINAIKLTGNFPRPWCSARNVHLCKDCAVIETI